MEYYAHYDKEKDEKQLLRDHLLSVANLAREQILPCVKFDEIDNLILKEAIYWMGYTHDIGKYSTYFQNYLIYDKDSKLKEHAHISACYAYNLLNSFLSHEIKNTSIINQFIFFCYLSIRLHHTSLRMEKLFNKNVWDKVEKLEKHLKSKREEIFKDLMLPNTSNANQFISFFDIKRLKNNKKYMEYIPLMLNNGRISDPKWYFLIIYLFSILIDIDKLDSAYVVPHEVKLISHEFVSKYLKAIINNFNKEKTDLIKRREEARISMLKVIDRLNDEEIKQIKFFTLTAPTGIGKTLSSLQCALKLQERIKKIEGYTPRIITAIPFINIIEQNAKEYEKVISDKAKVIVHHRLSDLSSKISSYKETPVDKALLETESWDADVILTTFVQFFHSLFTNKNKPLKKINKIAGSIVILDEIQSLPEEYMPLIGATLYMIAKYYGTRFILMTATQPKILDFGEKLLLEKNTNINFNCYKKIELLPDNQKYFNQLNRTKFIPILDKRISSQEFLNIFFEKWQVNKSALIVVNTIKRSIEIYNELKKKLEELGYSVPVYYLSTNIIPKNRKKVIDEVRNIIKANKQVILVSTQTIEAGVDLDFDIGFRDFAPLDSLVQTAGRINREGKKGLYCPVYIVQLEKDNHYIYNLSHRESTLKLLKTNKEIKEDEYKKLIEKYYDSALDRGISDKSHSIWDKGIIKLDFEALKEFKLINNIDDIVDVFIEYDEIASNLADAYEALLKYEDYFDYDLDLVLGEKYKNIKGKLNFFQRKALIRILVAKMNDYIIQIRKSRILKNKPIEFSARSGVESQLYWVPKEQISQYYNDETGFIDESGESFIF